MFCWGKIFMLLNKNLNIQVNGLNYLVILLTMVSNVLASSKNQIYPQRINIS